jgi:esterase/lipase superfamily enzyme
MWLRDWLPRELPGTRAIIYGYDTELEDSTSVQDIEELVRRFALLLETLAPSLSHDRPVILMGHSMGGILLKHALVKMDETGSETQKAILAQVKEVVFFGVPNRGMEISHLHAMVVGHPNEKLVQRLAPSSQYLKALDRYFYDVATKWRIRLISVYETSKSPTVKVLSTKTIRSLSSLTKEVTNIWSF